MNMAWLLIIIIFLVACFEAYGYLIFNKNKTAGSLLLVGGFLIQLICSLALWWIA